MNLTYVIDYVFRQTPDGRVWTDTSYDAAFWQPYVDVYGQVTLLCRVERVEQQSPAWKQVTSADVHVKSLPMYLGAAQYLKVAGKIKQIVKTTLAASDGVILRMPSNLARCAAKELRRTGRRYAVEVVGDPYESMAPGVVKMLGRPLYRSLFTRAQKAACLRATGVAYVAEVLHKRYPASAGRAVLVCSDARLDEHWLRGKPRTFESKLHHEILTVATLSQVYKGIDVLIRAVRLCKDRRCDVSLTIVGTGRHRTELEELAAKLNVSQQVRFAGVIAWGPELIAAYDRADLFVLPSRVEAMPRALLEAMARGLPAIATDVGAVHELLEPGRLVPAGDAIALAHQIIFITLQAKRLEAASARNVAKAAGFAAELLVPRWRGFHEELQHEFAVAPLPAPDPIRITAAA